MNNAPIQTTNEGAGDTAILTPEASRVRHHAE